MSKSIDESLLAIHNIASAATALAKQQGLDVSKDHEKIREITAHVISLYRFILPDIVERYEGIIRHELDR